MDKTVVRKASSLPMLLVEPDALLRRTVAMTARSLGLSEICEAGNPSIARRLIKTTKFGGAIVALDYGERRYAQYDLSLIDDIRRYESVESPVPIALMLTHCDEVLLQEFRERNVTRIILKPYRARMLLDTFKDFLAA